jgi:hypothetical protein
MRTSALMALFLMMVTFTGLTGCQSDRRTSHGTSTSTPAPESDAMDVEQTFRRHYDSHYSNTGYAYSQYRPAYRYGYDLASDPEYRNQAWSAIERTAPRGWDHSKMGDWEQYKDAVRYGWETKRNTR